MADSPNTGNSDSFGRFADGVAQVVSGMEPGARVTTLRRLSGGASQESWLIEGGAGGKSIELVMRRGQGGTSEKRDVAIGLEAEAELIQQAAKVGVPVPEVLKLLRPEDGLGSGFIMRRVHGETIARKILRDERFAPVRPKLAGMCGKALAWIGGIPVDACPALRTMTAKARLDEIDEEHRASGIRRPVFEYAHRWLRERLPAAPAQLRVVHGDFRNGNLIIDEQGIAAVLDWELAHIGDPMEDLAWLCVPSWRFGEIDKPAGGFGTLDQLVEGYEGAGGPTVDRAAVHFWTVLGALAWGQSCVNFAIEFRGGDRTVERAAIGRRASETEVDLMMLTRAKDGQLI